MQRVLAAVTFILLATPAAADQTDPRLDAFFAELKTVPGPAAVSKIDTQIGATLAGTLSKEVLEPHAVAFESGDGTQLSGYFFTPEGEGPFNVVLMMHGCAGLLNKKVL